jgi:WD40 repeat protein
VRTVRAAHREVINGVARVLAGAGELLATASDDGSVRVWDPLNSKHPLSTFTLGVPVTGVSWSADGASVYCAALDNLVHVWDLRKAMELSTLAGHSDTPTSLALSPNGEYLLSPSLSSQTLVHDVRPFSPAPSRVHRTLLGAPAGFEGTLLRGAWSRHDGGKLAAVGGADRMVCVWDVESARVVYKLPGHKVCFCVYIASVSTSLCPFSCRCSTFLPILPFLPVSCSSSSSSSCSSSSCSSYSSRPTALPPPSHPNPTTPSSHFSPTPFYLELTPPQGTVTAVDFHPTEPIILTASKDGTMLLGELDAGA